MQDTLSFPNTPIVSVLEQKHFWQLWLLKTSSQGKSVQLRLVYSWIVPSSVDKEGWSDVLVSSFDFQNEDKKLIKFELIRGDFICTGVMISKYITGLLSGKYLSEIDNGGYKIPTAFINLKLGDSNKDVANKFSIRPEVLLPIDHLLVPWDHKTTPNPSGFSIFVNQLFFHQKISMITFDGFKGGKEISIINHLADILKRATGFDFRKESAPRLGNIEWFRLPVTNDNLYPLVSFWVNKTDPNKEKSIVVRFEALKDEIKKILFRCRVVNGEEVSLDEVRKARWSDEAIEFEFQCLQPPSEIQVTVWECNNDNLHATIIFEQSYHCLRTVATTISVVGSQINSGKINLLDKLNGKEEEAKGLNLARFSRSTSAGTTEVGRYENDPWIRSSRSIISFMKELFPAKSEGQFFANGWDELMGQSGQLSFIEWIFKLVSGESSGGLILLDPFLDKDAIEIFSHARTTNTEYHIVTCTQHRERAGQIAESGEIDEPSGTQSKKEGTMTKAGLSIQGACEKMLPLLKGLKLTITDLRSENKGKQQLFHDRYLLLLNKNGGASKGFHLSNSLQGATRKAPLLITPIPGDILGAVFCYVTDLINPDQNSSTSKKIELVKLYPNNVKEKVLNIDPVNIDNIDEKSVKRLNEIPDVGFLFTTLFNDSELAKADLQLLSLKLKQMGIMNNETSSFLMYNVSPDHLAAFASRLPILIKADFDKIINSLGECLARSQSCRHVESDELGIVYDAFQELMAQLQKHPQLADKLTAFIKDYKGEINGRDGDRIFQLFNGETFEDVVEETKSHLNYMSCDFFGIKYSYYYACKILIRCFPGHAVGLLEDLIKKVVVLGWNEAIPEVRFTLALISTVAHCFLRYFVCTEHSDQILWLDSKDYRVRAASASALIHGLLYDQQRSPQFEEVEQMLRECLLDEEYRLAISAFCSELYIRTNSPDQVELLQKSYNAIGHNWIGDEQLIGRVVKVLGGRLEYNHSDSISLHYLDILINEQELDVDWCMDFWNRVFAKKIKPDDLYVNTGSDSLPYVFSRHTDVKLTITLIHYFSRVDADKQVQVLKEWINLLEPMWSLIHQPFASSSNFDHYDNACERIFWVKLLLEKSKTANLATFTKSQINTFLESHERSITVVEWYVQGKAFAPILELMQI